MGLAATSTWSAESWFKTTTNDATSRWITGEASSTNATPLWSITVANAKVNFQVKDAAAKTVTITSTSTVTDGGWHHVAVARNGSAFKLYLDGNLAGSATNTQIAASIALDRTAIGAKRAAATSGFFNGSVDDVAYYPTELSAARVSAHRNAAVYTYAPLTGGNGTRLDTIGRDNAGAVTDLGWKIRPLTPNTVPAGQPAVAVTDHVDRSQSGRIVGEAVDGGAPGQAAGSRTRTATTRPVATSDVHDGARRSARPAKRTCRGSTIRSQGDARASTCQLRGSASTRIGPAESAHAVTRCTSPP